jgi:hypothetical protein
VGWSRCGVGERIRCLRLWSDVRASTHGVEGASIAVGWSYCGAGEVVRCLASWNYGRTANRGLVVALRPPVELRGALQALSDIGARDKTGIAALVAALSLPRASVRNVASNALFKIDPEAAAKAGVKPPSP